MRVVRLQEVSGEVVRSLDDLGSVLGVAD